MSDRLTGKTALVTGAGSGIGQRVAQRFVAEGARVVFADRNLPAAQQATADTADDSDRMLAVEMDIADEASVAAGYAAAAAAGFAVDVVVANAGVQLFGQDAPIADLELDVWQRTIAVNLTGTFLTLKYAVRAMLDDSRATPGGSIILTGSPTGLNGEGSTFTAYSSSKGGMHSMGRAVAMAYADRGIRVNTAVPGYTETPLVTAISGDPADRAAIVSRIPMGRPGRPEDVEGIMVFLASDESSYATGAIFRVDGGMTSL
ncbi:SDR family NAD(P)-dependent oxidoreductase [Nakamurella leprariae]|uniref:SDR family oxidoreductase n=1 Tax=Nakamurella leprariae TaxID=2803911 RepID=A0A938YK87_9ACTN|nr:SDR family NAD(P)-dependent oxidoreductase [Nakamurella leprariae]MBM9469398.1 SDR family oxidoreductase [Nakamurella leprariae]